MRSLYSGTFKRFATPFPDTFQTSTQTTLHVTHKHNKEPLGKGGEERPTAFGKVLIQLLG